MDKVKPLAEKTFLLYASKHYNNPQCESIDEFYEDLNRIKYVKRLLRKFVKSGVLRERLILNHLIILQNVFGASCSSRMLFFKIDKELFPQLKTFLVYLKSILWGNRTNNNISRKSNLLNGIKPSVVTIPSYII